MKANESTHNDLFGKEFDMLSIETTVQFCRLVKI